MHIELMLSKCCPVRVGVGAAHRTTFVRLGGPRHGSKWNGVPRCGKPALRILNRGLVWRSGSSTLEWRPLVREYWSTPFLSKTKKTRLVSERHRANAKAHHLKQNAKDLSKVSATAPRKNKNEQERQPYAQTAQPPFSMFVSCLPGTN